MELDLVMHSFRLERILPDGTSECEGHFSNERCALLSALDRRGAFTINGRPAADIADDYSPRRGYTDLRRRSA